MVTPVPPWLRGAKPKRATRRSPRDDPPHPLPHHAGAHAVNDAEVRLLGQHRRVHRRDRGRLGLVAGHAAEVDLQRRPSAAAGREADGSLRASRCLAPWSDVEPGRRPPPSASRRPPPRACPSARSSSTSPAPPVASRTRSPTPTRVRPASPAARSVRSSRSSASALLPDALLHQPPRLAGRRVVGRAARARRAPPRPAAAPPAGSARACSPARALGVLLPPLELRLARGLALCLDREPRRRARRARPSRSASAACAAAQLALALLDRREQRVEAALRVRHPRLGVGQDRRAIRRAGARWRGRRSGPAHPSGTGRSA